MSSWRTTSRKIPFEANSTGGSIEPTVLVQVHRGKDLALKDIRLEQ